MVEQRSGIIRPPPACKPARTARARGLRPAPAYAMRAQGGTMRHDPARALSPLDRLLVDAQNALGTLVGPPVAHAPTRRQARRTWSWTPATPPRRRPDADQPCRRGLRPGPVFRPGRRRPRPATRDHLLEAAQEETDHLAWCADRLEDSTAAPACSTRSGTPAAIARHAGRAARRRLEPRLRGGNRAPGRSASGRAPGDPARSRPAQPRDPQGDEGRRSPPCRTGGAAGARVCRRRSRG